MFRSHVDSDDGTDTELDKASILKEWHDNGFILRRGFFDPARIERINDLINQLWQTRGAQSNKLVIDMHLNSSEHRRRLFKDVPDEARLSPYKLNDLYLEHDEIRNIVLDVGLTRIMAILLAGKPLVINTLNFEYGSEQDDHVDTFYMPPKKQNCMLASWIALETVTLQSGPIRYYPGSHKIPPYLFSHGRTNAITSELPAFYDYMDNQLKDRNIKAETFTAEAGDLFIWHAQLLHGGIPIAEPGATRRSLVTHYFRKSEYRHLFWRIRKVHEHGYFYKRPHQAPT